MPTLEELRNEAGQLLGLTREGQSLAADHDAMLVKAYERAYDSLSNEGIAPWAEDGEVPARVLNHVAAIMAFDCSTKVSLSEARYNRILSLRNIARPEIRKEMASPYESYTEADDY